MILRGRLPSRDRHAKIIALRQASRYRAPSRKSRTECPGNRDKKLFMTKVITKLSWLITETAGGWAWDSVLMVTDHGTGEPLAAARLAGPAAS